MSGQDGGVGDVVVERVVGLAGHRASVVNTGPGDLGLWRVRSAEHGTQLVVGRAQAVAVARRLTAGTTQVVSLVAEPDEHAGSAGVSSNGERDERRQAVRREGTDRRQASGPSRAPHDASSTGGGDARRHQSNCAERQER